MNKKTPIPDYLKAALTAACVLFLALSFFLKCVRISDVYSTLYTTNYTQNVSIYEMANLHSGVGIHPNILMLLWALASCAVAIAFVWLNSRPGSIGGAASLLVLMMTTLSKNYDVDDIWAWKPYEGYYAQNSEWRFMTFGKYHGSYYLLWFLCILIVALAICTLVLEGKEKETPAQVKKGNTLDDLVKYKELLDNGTLTEEEFEKIKQEILNN